MNRRNLQVITGETVDRILFEGKRAVGVRFVRGGASHDIKVNDCTWATTTRES